MRSESAAPYKLSPFVHADEASQDGLREEMRKTTREFAPEPMLQQLRFCNEHERWNKLLN